MKKMSSDVWLPIKIAFRHTVLHCNSYSCKWQEKSKFFCKYSPEIFLSQSHDMTREAFSTLFTLVTTIMSSVLRGGAQNNVYFLRLFLSKYDKHYYINFQVIIIRTRISFLFWFFCCTIFKWSKNTIYNFISQMLLLRNFRFW